MKKRLTLIPLLLLLLCSGCESAPMVKPVELSETQTIPTATTAAPTTEVPTTEAPTTEPLPPPTACQLEVPYLSQEDLLPTGCELISGMMVLKYYGITPTVLEVTDATYCVNLAEKDGKLCGPHPTQAFIGSPWDPTSFGCFPPVVVEMMNFFLPEELVAVDTTGTDLQTLAETYLPQEKPVLVWATISMLEHFPNISWYLADEDGNPTEEHYAWQANEHCLVLVGYDETHYYFNDPYKSRGLVSYKKSLVEERFTSMGSYSLVVTDAE